MRYLVLSGALLLACLPAVAQSKYDAPMRPVVVVRQAPPVVVRPAPVVEYVMPAPRPVETPILSVGSRCLRVLGFPLVCGG